MRTKKEIVDFLESKVGKGVECKGNPSLDSQCVTLIKALMEFVGVPDPYKSRGHGKDCIAKYLSEGIADKGTGFLSVFSNKDMGSGYGHIWCNAGEGDGIYYESNGSKPLTVTKGKTYSYDNVCNFDKYIKEATMVGELMQIEKADFEKLMKEAKIKDEQIDLLLVDKKSLEEDVRELNDDIEKLAEDLGSCLKLGSKHKIDEEVKVAGFDWVINGVRVDSNGLIVGNYSKK